MAAPTPDHMSRKEAAAYLTRSGCRISARTLEQMAANNNAGKGPPFSRHGWRTISYAKIDLDGWREKRVERVE